MLSDRSHVFLKTVQFHPFEPSSFIPLDRPVLALWNVHLHFLRPSSFTPLDRSLIFLKTVQFGSPDPTVFFLWTVHLRRPSTLSRLDRPV